MSPTDILFRITSPAQLAPPEIPPTETISRPLYQPRVAEPTPTNNNSSETSTPPNPPIALQLALLHTLVPFAILTPTHRIMPLGAGYSPQCPNRNYAHPSLNPDHRYAFSNLGDAWRRALAVHAPLVSRIVFDLSFPRPTSALADPGPAADQYQGYGWHFEKAFEVDPHDILCWVVEIATEVRMRMDLVGLCSEVHFEVVYGTEEDDGLCGFSEEWKASLKSHLALAMRWPAGGSRLAGGVVELA